MYGRSSVDFELSDYQQQIIAEVDALLVALPPGTVDESRSGVSIAVPGQQHGGNPPIPTIDYTVIPSAPDAARLELNIGSVRTETGVTGGAGFYWESNSQGEFSKPWLASVVPLCEAVIAGRLTEGERFRGIYEVTHWSRLEVRGLERPIGISWTNPWIWLAFWLGPIRDESRQYAPWA